MTDNGSPKRITAAFIAVVVVSFLVLTSFAYVVKETRDLAHANEELLVEVSKSHDVQCAQRDDLDKAIEQTQTILDENPKAKIIFAIPRKLFEDSLARNKQTRENLSILDCERK